LRQAAGRVEREGAVVAKERLAVRRHEQDVSLARPAAHHHVGAEPRHAPRLAAFRRHQVNLRVLFVAAHEREPLAVGRQARRGRLAQSRGEPARGAAVRMHAPQVVVAHEDDRVALQCRLAQIALIDHGELRIRLKVRRTRARGAERNQNPRW
jgi:hypothetical protein